MAEIDINYLPVKNQLAGHILTDTGTPCLLESSVGTILKLIQPPPKGHVELTFYKHLITSSIMNDKLGKNSTSLMSSDSGISNLDQETNKKCLSKIKQSKQLLLEQQYSPQLQISNPLLTTLRNKFVPKFYGIRTVNGYDYLEIENLTTKFKNACTCDIKIGRVSYDPLADENKRQKCYEKFPLQSEFGYQFLGIRRGNCQKNKIFGRSLNQTTIHQAFDEFLPAEKGQRMAIKMKIVKKLEKLLEWFESQSSLQFYGSSLLVLYSLDDFECDVKMIDFAHVFYEEMVDENYIFGLKNLICAFKKY